MKKYIVNLINYYKLKKHRLANEFIFFNDPIKDQDVFINIVNNIINFKHKKNKVLLIFLNCKKDVLKEFKDIDLVNSHYINNNKGFSIYCIKS